MNQMRTKEEIDECLSWAHDGVEADEEYAQGVLDGILWAIGESDEKPHE